MSDALSGSSAVTPTESELLIAVFSDEEVAGSALAAIKQAQDAGGIKFDAAAVIRREDDGALHIRETSDISTAAGAVAGGILGGLLGLLTGKKVAGAGMGALLGAGAAHMVDAGIPDQRLAEIADTLPNGTSALAVLMDAAQHDAATSLLAPLNGVFTSETIKTGVQVNVPKTGIDSVDRAARQAADAVAPLAATAAASISAAQDSAEDLARQAGDSARATWQNAASGAGEVAQQVSESATQVVAEAKEVVEETTEAAADAASGAIPTS